MKKLLVLLVVLGALGGVGWYIVTVPTQMTAPMIGQAPADYDPANDRVLRYTSGLGCTARNPDKELLIVDHAVAKAGAAVAAEHADRVEANALLEAANGPAREQVLASKARELDHAEPFSDEARARMGEWDALKRFFDAAAQYVPAPYKEGAQWRHEAITKDLEGLECPHAADAIRDRIRRHATLQSLGRLEAALARFYTDLGEFPEVDEVGLKGLVAVPTEHDNASRWAGPYAEAKDFVDGWGNPIQYSDLSRRQMYSLKSLGSDGKPGGQYDYADLIVMGSSRIRQPLGARPPVATSSVAKP